MRRVKIAAVMLMLLLACSIGSLFMLRSCNEKLEASIIIIAEAWDEGRKSDALRAAEEMNGYWHLYERTVTMIIHDDALEELNISVSKLPPLIKSDSEEVSAEIESTLHQLGYIYDEECPYWFNIL